MSSTAGRYPPGRRAYLRRGDRAGDARRPRRGVSPGAAASGRSSGWRSGPAWPRRRRGRAIGSAAWGRRPTDLHHGRFRSLLTGQANAVLVARRHAVTEHRTLVLNGRLFVAREARRLRLETRALAWTPSGGSAQALRFVLRSVDSNRAASPAPDAPARPVASPRRSYADAVRFGEELASGGEPLVVAGDVNLTPLRLPWRS